jgi:hypothetical protein
LRGVCGGGRSQGSTRQPAIVYGESGFSAACVGGRSCEEDGIQFQIEGGTDSVYVSDAADEVSIA